MNPIKQLNVNNFRNVSNVLDAINLLDIIHVLYAYKHLVDTEVNVMSKYNKQCTKRKQIKIKYALYRYP